MNMAAIISASGGIHRRNVVNIAKLTARTSSSNTKSSCTFWPRKLPDVEAASSTAVDRTPTGMPSTPLDPKHDQPLGSWKEEQINQAVNDHVMLTWMPSKARHQLPIITKAEGPYMYDVNGKEYLDWTSQAVCANL